MNRYFARMFVGRLISEFYWFDEFNNFSAFFIKSAIVQIKIIDWIFCVKLHQFVWKIKQIIYIFHVLYKIWFLVFYPIWKPTVDLYFKPLNFVKLPHDTITWVRSQKLTWKFWSLFFFLIFTRRKNNGIFDYL